MSERSRGTRPWVWVLLLAVAIFGALCAVLFNWRQIEREWRAHAGEWICYAAILAILILCFFRGKRRKPRESGATQGGR